MDNEDAIEKRSISNDETPKSERKNSTHLLEPKFPEKLDNAESQQETKKKFPKSVFFIVGNEFCERFSYYGMRTVLSIYMTSALGMDQTTATAIYHTFVMVCYFTPVLGSMLADGYLGKFRTIFYVSLIYALGNIVLSMASMPPLKFPMMPMSMVALFLISLGTGGIKPCVSAFGGDQFDNDQLRQRERFFFIFYFSINAGSLISTFLTPILKDDVSCFGQDTCYALAFGLPAILMIVAIILFVSGKRMYRMYPPKDNIIVKVSKCVGHAISRRWNTKTRTKDHWLDYADDKFEKKFISDVRAALRVMFLYIPLPVFWALFDQQGSLWTFQAQELDGRLSSSYTIIPEQMQVVNPLLILIFIPIFESGIYPLLAKCNLLKKSLHRVFVGGMFAALAFVVAAGLQLAIEANYPSYPSEGYTDVVFINNGPCALNIQSMNDSVFTLDVTLDNTKFFSENMKIHIGNIKELPILVTPVDADQCKQVPAANFSVSVEDGSAFTVAFIVHDNVVEMYKEPQVRKKPENGNAALRLVYNLPVEAAEGMQIMFKKKDSESTNCTFIIGNSTAGITLYDTSGNNDDYCTTTPGVYILHLPKNGTHGEMFDTGKEIHPQNGGQYDYNIYASTSYEQVSVNYYIEVAENDINMLYQIPQYVIITAGEIMFSITGLEFSYSQAPASMKSVLQAAWLLTDAFGNLIIIIISEAKFFDMYSYEYFLYAGIMVVVMLIFAFMATSYVYVTIDQEGNVIYPEGQEFKKKKSPKKSSETNAGFSEEHENANM